VRYYLAVFFLMDIQMRILLVEDLCTFAHFNRLCCIGQSSNNGFGNFFKSDMAIEHTIYSFFPKALSKTSQRIGEAGTTLLAIPQPFRHRLVLISFSGRNGYYSPSVFVIGHS
jgi:hypothetical protein